MSDRTRNVDLSALSQPTSAPPPPRRRWLAALVPVLLLGGFAWVIWDSAAQSLADAVPVTVVRPRPVDDAGASSGGTRGVTLQASGWVEPDPFRVRVTALASGVVAKMLAQESDAVDVGDPVCELVPDDAQLALETTEAELALARAHHDAAMAELTNALASFEAALGVTEAAETTAADAQSRSAELARREAAVDEARAVVEVARNELETQRFLRDEDAAGPWQLELARARVDETEARVLGLEAEALRAAADLAVSEARRRRAAGDLELRLDEQLRIDLARASTKRTEAAVQLATSAVSTAQLRRSRMTVRSPIAGVVLTRDAHEGSVVGPTSDDISVCHLYDPNSLRVRVDVPLAQIAAATVGQRAEIRCDARRDRPYAGTVLRIVETADIQKVTLEIQVRVDEPDERIKPDMLCQVSFLGAATSAGPDGATNSRAVTIPARCLVEDGLVWVVDATTGLAAQRRIRVGETRGDDILVLEGLNITDKVIDGGRTQVSQDDALRLESTQ